MSKNKPPQVAKKNEVSIVRSSAAEYLTFVAASGQGGVEAVYADENVWVTQKMMGLLYDVETHTINYHLKKVFGDSELVEDSVIRKFRITAAFLLISFPSALPSSRFCPGQLAAGSFCFSTWRCFYQWRWC